jgi:serine phosphatase RsbU (regulator of sigma subunit)
VKRLFELINEQQSAMEKHRASLEEVNKKIENWVGDLEADFSIANAVQRALIPQRFPDLKHIRFQGYFRPGFSRGGDFFDVFSFRERGEVGLIHLDSAGHSLLSGLVSALMKISASQEGAHVTHPVDGMVSSIAASLSPVMELTKMTARMRVGALDPKRLQFEFCDFDMGALYQVHADGRAPSKIQTSTAEAFKGTASLAGLSHKSVQCAPGDVLLFPSDGCDSVVSDMLDILKKRRGDDLLEVRNELAFLIQDPDLKAEDDASFILAQISPQALQLISS